MELYKNREWMYYHYWVLEESMYVMAQLVGCSVQTIWYWLHRLGIPTRTIFEAKRNHLDISEEFLNLMGGELLGDGCIIMSSLRSAKYQHTSKYEEYLIWLSGGFASQGLEQTGKIYKQENEWGIVHHYQSKSYPELVPIWQKWYSNGKKIVPQDLKLTPIMVRQWYIGDGCLAHPKNRSLYIELATCAFDRSSIDHLLEELSGLGFKATLRPARSIIGISTYSTQDFLNYIGPCPQEIENIYGYKWDY